MVFGQGIGHEDIVSDLAAPLDLLLHALDIGNIGQMLTLTDLHQLGTQHSQAGFLVLNATSMPSILVELGYISNAEESKYLASSSAQKRLSECISEAFSRYYADLKKVREGSLSANNYESTALEATNHGQPAGGEVIDVPVFKIQFLSSSKQLGEAADFKGLSPVSCYYDGGLYKYTYGETTDYNEILRLKRKVNLTNI